MQNPILNTGTYKELKGLLSEGGGPLFLSGAVDSVKAMLSAALSASGWGMLVLSSEQRAKSFLRELRSLTEQSFYYPAKDLLFYQADTQGTLITRQRVEALSHLTEDESGILVTTIDALMDKIWDRESFQGAVLRLAPGQIHELSALSKKLTSLGYQRLPAVEAMGEYSLRGGILDIYPFTAENPIRLEFWNMPASSWMSPQDSGSGEGWWRRSLARAALRGRIRTALFLEKRRGWIQIPRS